MKILVSGNAGAGKSSLGIRLAERYNLIAHGLDKVVWKEGWVKTPKDEREVLIADILSSNEWVIEGITRTGLKEADIVYFLDIPAYRCAFNVIIRFLKTGLGTRKDLPPNCPEYIGFLKALKTNFIFYKITRPWLLDETQRKPGAKFIHLKSYADVEKLFLSDSCDEYDA